MVIRDCKYFYIRSLFHRVCEGGNIKLLKLLIEHGADVHAPTKSGKTPFDIALASWSRTEV